MIPLGVYGKALNCEQSVLGRITFEDVDESVRGDHVRVFSALNREDVRGYAAILVCEAVPDGGVGMPIPIVHTVTIDYLRCGDVVSLDSRGYVRTLYRRGSPHNAIFATDRCNSFCVMCSQPPK